MKFIKSIVLFFFYAFLFSDLALGQVLLPGTFDFEYYKLLLSKNEFKNEPISYFPSIITDYAPDSTLAWNIWSKHKKYDQKAGALQIVAPTVGFVYNSKMPRSYNDGAVWTGKGANSWVSTGVYGKIKTGDRSFFSYTFAPVAYFAQNAYFTIPDTDVEKSNFSYPFYQKLDFVERYGNESFMKVHPGQSEIKYVYRGLTAGFSTQNVVWGPAIFNPILMSQQAPGIPHFNLGFNTPINTRIGRLDGKVFWGALQESAYYDGDPGNNRRYITGFTGGYAPSFIKGLNVGLHRVMYRRWNDSLAFKDVFAALFNTSSTYNTPLNGVLTNDVYDQMASLSVRWNRPELGLEIYVEYARNDFAGTLTEFLRNPDRSRAITIAASEAFELNNGKTVKLLYENTTLSANQLQIYNIFASPTYYVHGFLDHGYTHDGQIVGAGIGPGSNTHIVQAQYFTSNSMLSLSAQRIRFNDDYILREFAGALKYPSEFEMAYSIRYKRLFQRLELEAQLLYSYRYEWYFIPYNNHANLSPSFNVRYLIAN